MYARCLLTIFWSWAKYALLAEFICQFWSLPFIFNCYIFSEKLNFISMLFVIKLFVHRFFGCALQIFLPNYWWRMKRCWLVLTRVMLTSRFSVWVVWFERSTLTICQTPCSGSTLPVVISTRESDLLSVVKFILSTDCKLQNLVCIFVLWTIWSAILTAFI